MLKFVTRMLLIVVVFVGLYAGISRVIAASADGAGRSLARSFLLEIRRSEALRQRAAELALALEIKKSITEDVIAGHLTLREAVEQFRAAYAIVQANGMIGVYRSPDGDEGLCCQVIAWVRTVLKEQHPASEAETILHRLERERETQFPSAKILD